MIRELRREMNGGFEAMDTRFDSLNRNLIITLVTVVGAFIGINFT